MNEVTIEKLQLWIADAFRHLFSVRKKKAKWKFGSTSGQLKISILFLYFDLDVNWMRGK